MSGIDRLLKRLRKKKMCPMCDKPIEDKGAVIRTATDNIVICNECGDVFEAMNRVRTGDVFGEQVE